jgi:hypothetical protein
LTESRFLHDEEGVKSKFHPDDMEVNVVKDATGAPFLAGDGRYDAEYTR